MENRCQTTGSKTKITIGRKDTVESTQSFPGLTKNEDFNDSLRPG